MTAASTLNLGGLNDWLASLSISNMENTNETDTLANPLDICRLSLAQTLSDLANCDIQDALKAIHWPNNIFNGDLSVTVPRLQPGCKPAELSADLVNKVICLYMTIASTLIRPIVPKRSQPLRPSLT